VTKKIHECKYVETKKSREGNTKKELNGQIVQAKQATQRSNALLWSKEIRNETKVRILDSIIMGIFEVLDFFTGYESHLRKRRISVSSKRGATNRPENIVIRYVKFPLEE
jgi:hypothetical protein